MNVDTLASVGNKQHALIGLDACALSARRSGLCDLPIEARSLCDHDRGQNKFNSEALWHVTEPTVVSEQYRAIVEWGKEEGGSEGGGLSVGLPFGWRLYRRTRSHLRWSFSIHEGALSTALAAQQLAE